MPKRPAPPEARSVPPDEATIATKKTESTLQLLFKAARLLDEEALARVAALPNRPRFRRAHTALLPHVDFAGTRVTDLAERVGVTKQAVSQLLDDLEAYDVVARIPDPADARSRLVVFTDKGKKSILEGLAVLMRLEADLEKAIGAPTMKALREGALSVVAAVEAGAVAGARDAEAVATSVPEVRTRR